MKRCDWPNLEKSDIYKDYHDNEWGIESHDDNYLFSMLILETFHCGLSWLIVLKKRKAFFKAFDNFDPKKMASYNEDKILSLINNKDIIRNKSKITSAVLNAKAYLLVVEEFGSFESYIWSFTDNKVIYIPNKRLKNSSTIITKNSLSDRVSKDLKARGFKYMGSVTTFSYLEAVGVMNNHSTECYLCKKQKDN